jgi:hypothetical protein
VFLKVQYLSIINLPFRITDLALPHQLKLVPLSFNHLPARKHQSAFTGKLVAETVANVLIAIQELKVPADLYALLVVTPTS